MECVCFVYIRYWDGGFFWIWKIEVGCCRNKVCFSDERCYEGILELFLKYLLYIGKLVFYIFIKFILCMYLFISWFLFVLLWWWFLEFGYIVFIFYCWLVVIWICFLCCLDSFCCDWLVFLFWWVYLLFVCVCFIDYVIYMRLVLVLIIYRIYLWYIYKEIWNLY